MVILREIETALRRYREDTKCSATRVRLSPDLYTRVHGELESIGATVQSCLGPHWVEVDTSAEATRGKDLQVHSVPVERLQGHWVDGEMLVEGPAGVHAHRITLHLWEKPEGA